MCLPQHEIITKGQARREHGIDILALDDYGYGRFAGCLGVNCGHYITPFVVGVNELPELDDDVKDITEEQAIENARAQAKQRAFERDIRKNKERMEIAKIFHDKDKLQHLKLREKTLKGGLKHLIENNKFLRREYAKEKYHYDENKINSEVDKRRKAEYSEILRILGSRAPKNYGEYIAVEPSVKEELKRDAKTVSYILNSDREELSKKQKKQAVEAYYSFKDNGVTFSGHAISQYIARMRRKNGRLMYNFNSVLDVSRKQFNLKSENKDRPAKYYNKLLLVYEKDLDIIVTFMKTEKPAKTFKEIER